LESLLTQLLRVRLVRVRSARTSPVCCVLIKPARPWLLLPTGAVRRSRHFSSFATGKGGEGNPSPLFYCGVASLEFRHHRRHGGPPECRRSVACPSVVPQSVASVVPPEYVHQVLTLSRPSAFKAGVFDLAFALDLAVVAAHFSAPSLVRLLSRAQ